MENNCNNSVAIYLAYHKPSIIIQNDVLTPIHSGKSISSLDLGIMGDDTGDNISILGDALNELTVLYWMWKNDTTHAYLGLCHYRRILIFNPDLIRRIKKPREIIPYLSDNFEDEFGWRSIDILNAIEDTDIIISRYWHSPIGRTHGEQYIRKHGIAAYQALVSGVKNYAPDYYPYLMECLDGKKLIPGNMFVMRRYLLDEYCNWLFPLLNKVNPEIDHTKVTAYGIRQGFAAERLFHAYIEKLKVDHPEINIRHHPFLFIEDTSPDIRAFPAIIKETLVIPIVYILNKELIPLFCVQLESLKTVALSDHFYDLIIMSETISEKDQKILTDQISQNKNMGIRFFSIDYLSKKDTIHNKSQGNKEIIAKLSIASILPDYDKVLIFPPNVIILEDLAKIYQDNYDDYFAAAVISLEIMASRLRGSPVQKPFQKFSHLTYFEKVVGLSEKNIESYFNSNLMILNLKKIRAEKLEEKFVELYNSHNYCFQDQDIFNKSFNGNIKSLPQRWNLIYLDKTRVFQVLPFYYWLDYENAMDNPAIINFQISENSFLLTDNNLNTLSFWKFARTSPYYEILLKKYLSQLNFSKQTTPLSQFRINLIKYVMIIKKLLSEFIITFHLRRLKG